MADAVLDPAEELALAYASAPVRRLIETGLQLDRRLADVVRRASEPMIGQLKLAWWRDRLTQPVSEWPQGEPLLAQLAETSAPTAILKGLVDGWEALLAEQLDAEGIAQFAEGKADLFSWIASACDVPPSDVVRRAGRIVALADLAANLSELTDRERVLGLALELQQKGKPNGRLPSKLRPLAILAALSERSLARGGTPLASGPGAFALAVKVGILGK